MKPTLNCKICLAAILSIFVSQSCFGQFGQKTENPYANKPLKEKLFYGGDLGLSFGTITYIRIAPMVGVNLSPKLSFGLGPSYQYYSDNRYTPKYESSMYGGSIFGRYFIIDAVFAQAELEVLNLDDINSFEINGYTDRVTIPILLLGGGYSQRTPNGSGFFIGVFYDVIQDVNTPYPDTVVFRIGGMIAL